MKLCPKNWREFQHYKDRNPPWIRLHRKLLDDRDFQTLPVESRALGPMLWLLAAETVDGTISGDPAELAFRLRCSEADISKALAPLVERGFFLPADAIPVDPSLTNSQAVAKANGFGTRHIPDSVKREVWARDGGMCCTCESTNSLEYDHKIPVSKGGLSDVDNVQLLCRPCNRKKRTKTAEQVATPAQTHATDELCLRTPESESESESESDAETSQIRVEKIPTASATPAWFEEFRSSYPRRAGDQGWRKAERAAHARVSEGHNPAELIDGAKRYAAYCLATEKIGTEYVKQAATFLGPDKAFALPWIAPVTKAQAHQDSNVAASVAWLRKEHAAS